MNAIFLALIFSAAAMAACCLPGLALSLGHARLASALGLSQAVALAAFHHVEAGALWPSNAGPMGLAVPVTFAIWGALVGSLIIAGVAMRQSFKRVNPE